MTSAGANLESRVNPCTMTLAADVTEPFTQACAAMGAQEQLRPLRVVTVGAGGEGGWQGEGEDLPRQHHVVRVIFAPLPVFAGVDGKVKRQHLVLRVSERNHD